MQLHELATQVERTLPALGRREPPRVLHAAARLLVGAHLGEPSAVAWARQLATRAPGLRDLLTCVDEVVHAHLGPSAERAPAAARPSCAVAAGHRTRAARVHPRLRGSFEYVVLEPPLVVNEYVEAGDPHGDEAAPVAVVPWRALGDPLGAALDDAWSGPGGLGAQYLARDERALDWRVPSPDDGEPEWQFGD